MHLNSRLISYLQKQCQKQVLLRIWPADGCDADKRFYTHDNNTLAQQVSKGNKKMSTLMKVLVISTCFLNLVSQQHKSTTFKVSTS